VDAHGLRVYKGVLVVPVRDLTGVLHSLQFISPGGVKRFLQGGRIQGLCCWLGDLPEPTGSESFTVCLAEGFATGASLHQASGHAVAIAFHAGNLGAVASAIRARFPGARIVVCADDDVHTPDNPGRTLAREAARQVGGWLAVPDFGDSRPSDATDFNDLHRLRGLSAVQTTLNGASAPAPTPTGDAAPPSGVSSEWTDPEPLTSLIDGLPYPTDALPPLLRDAIVEAQAFVQSPAALVACSALSALSLAAQGLADVRRDHQLVGPVSLYLLAVAESGERKTTCDRIFGAPLRDWERDRAAACAPAVAAHEAAVASAEAKRAGLLEAIKRKRRDMQDTTEEDAALEELSIHAPVPVAVPRLLYADATPEALSHALATGWPSAAVLSAEAGAVFGAHGMGYETILRNLALLNVFWDGGEIAVDRRSKSSFQLRDRRLTFGVMVQPEAWRGFMARAGALPRGTGFIARFLIAWPASTQGQRLYRPAPAETPAVDRFNRRIKELLDMPLITDANGGLVPMVLGLSPSAHAEWVRAHDTIERELGGAGSYAPIRDVAAKAAENIARLAALLHLLEHGPQGAISRDCVDTATRLVLWHLQEAHRLLGDLDAPPALSAAIRFDAWLCSEAQRTGDGRIPTTRVYRYGPGCVRDNKDLKDALALLAEHGRARLEEDGRRRFVAVNPALYR
jgi:putative DNA primase/helicase